MPSMNEQQATWQTAPLEDDLAGRTRDGEIVGYQRADLSALAPGDYEYQLRLSRADANHPNDPALPIAQACGLLSVANDRQISQRDTTPPYQPAYTIPAQVGSREIISCKCNRSPRMAWTM